MSGSFTGLGTGTRCPGRAGAAAPGTRTSGQMAGRGLRLRENAGLRGRGAITWSRADSLRPAPPASAHTPAGGSVCGPKGLRRRVTSPPLACLSLATWSVVSGLRPMSISSSGKRRLLCFCSVFSSEVFSFSFETRLLWLFYAHLILILSAQVLRILSPGL